MLHDDIVKWIKTLPLWEQKLSSEILKGSKLTDEFLNTIYIQYRKDNGLSYEEIIDDVVVELPNIIETEDFKDDIIWLSVADIRGVNALRGNQRLNLAQGLNIIYGKNGAGKSGYTRLFNKAFKGKGDCNILSNVYSDSSEDLHATFRFKINSEKKDFEFPLDGDNSIFNHVMVFDTKSAILDVSKESELSFIPSEFDFFQKLVDACNSIETMLERDIRKAQSCANPANAIYADSTSFIANTLRNIDENTDIGELEEKFRLSDKDKSDKENRDKEIYELESLNISDKIKFFQNVKNQLELLVNNIQDSIGKFNKSYVESIRNIINDIHVYDSLSQAEGLSQFKSDGIPMLGSVEWKKFITSARDYYNCLDEKPTRCIFCGQSIDESITVIDRYWKFLDSIAENTLLICKKKLEHEKKEITGYKLVIPGIDTILGRWFHDNHEDVYAELVKFSKNFNQEIDDTLLSIAQLDNDIVFKDIVFDIQVFDSILKDIASKIVELNEVNVDKKLSELKEANNLYTDKERFAIVEPQLQKYISCLKWVRKARENKINTKSITNEHKKLFSQYISESYINIFNEECNKLDAGFKVKIDQRGSRGTTLKKLSIAGNSAESVLSEGELRALALADFFAEVRTSSDILSIIFDDPVSSLDYERRKKIARRICEEASERQVIVFTHDISFVVELINIASDYNVPKTVKSIRNVIQPGEIVEDLPWIAKNVTARYKDLNSRIKKLESMYLNDYDSYIDNAKIWCENLRESWERAVEEVLFGDVVKRFDPSIQTTRLSKAKFSKENVQKINHGMTSCSNWCHDRAANLGEYCPKPDELNAWLFDFKSFIEIKDLD